MSYKYARYISRVTRKPWAITPDKLEIIAELVRERAAGHKPTDEEIVARLGEDAERRGPRPQADGSVAVIPIHGVIAHRADSFDASSGGTSTELIGKMLQKVTADAGVNSILLDFDSPGGSVEGVPELAAQITKAALVKPVIGQVSALAASAGYWLASQCTEIVCTPSGMAGSIGVFLLVIDESEALEKAGVKVNAISAGDYKLEGAWWEPLSDEARAHLQGQVDACYKDFLAAVAKGRRVTAAKVKQDYGQGRVYDAKEALSRGMIDKISTMDDTLARLVGGRSASRRSMAAVIDETHEMQSKALVEAMEAVPPAASAELIIPADVHPVVKVAAEMRQLKEDLPKVLGAAVAEALAAETPTDDTHSDEAAIIAVLGED